MVMETLLLRKYEIDEIIETFNEGKVVAIPTDTVFGLGCVFDSYDAYERIKEIKHRDKDKPLPMMCNSLAMIEKVAYVDDKARKIIEKLTPGALTIILKKKEVINDYFTNHKDTIAIRIPDDELLLTIMTRLDKPLFMTSCNMANEPNIESYREIYSIFSGLVDALVMENAKSDVASTIVDLTKEKIAILREGIITKEKIEEVIL